MIRIYHYRHQRKLGVPLSAYPTALLRVVLSCWEAVAETALLPKSFQMVFEGPGPDVSPAWPVMSSQELIEAILLDAVRATGLVDVRFATEATKNGSCRAECCCVVTPLTSSRRPAASA